MKKRYAAFGISLLLSLVLVVAVGAFQKDAVLAPLALEEDMDPAEVPFRLAGDEDLKARIELARQEQTAPPAPPAAEETAPTETTGPETAPAATTGMETVPAGNTAETTAAPTEPSPGETAGGQTAAPTKEFDEPLNGTASDRDSASSRPLGSGSAVEGSGAGLDREDSAGQTAPSVPEESDPTAPPAQGEGSGDTGADNGGGETAGDGEVLSVTPGTSGEFTPEATVDDAWFDDALFIGDSRTDGLRLYARIGKADYFCNTGMTVFTALKKSLSDNAFSNMTLEQLLQSKTYGKILIGLGINECGSNLDSVMNAYAGLVDRVRELQPGAKVILQAVMACSPKKEAQNRCFGPENLFKLNNRIAALADGVNVFYINVNEVFADENGYLPANFSSDGCHLYAKYYPLWVSWIKSAVAAIPVSSEAEPPAATEGETTDGETSASTPAPAETLPAESAGTESQP